jgi:hypothetical protein
MNPKDIKTGKKIWFVYNWEVGQGIVEDTYINERVSLTKFAKIQITEGLPRKLIDVGEHDIFETEKEALEHCIVLCERREMEFLNKAEVMLNKRQSVEGRLNEIKKKRLNRILANEC